MWVFSIFRFADTRDLFLFLVLVTHMVFFLFLGLVTHVHYRYIRSEFTNEQRKKHTDKKDWVSMISFKKKVPHHKRNKYHDFMFLPYFLLCILKAVCDVIDWLITSNGVSLLASLVRIEWANLRFVSEAIL